MNIASYFNPVSIEKPDLFWMDQDEVFGRNIKIYTPNSGKISIEDFNVAVIGVDCLSSDNGISSSNLIRKSLYQMRSIEKIKILDLGNLVYTGKMSDTLSGLRDVCIDLIEKQVIPLIIGDSGEFLYSLFQTYKFLNKKTKIVSVDQSIDASFNFEAINRSNVLRKIIEENKNGRHLSEIICLGYQSYYTSKKAINLIENSSFKAIRLGELREGINEVEPDIRDVDIFSIDMNSIRHSDFPGNILGTPNGLYGEEACRLARYAGFSDSISSFALFETEAVQEYVSAALSAQIIWHFIEGLSLRNINEVNNLQALRKYIVNLGDIPGQEMIFYESALTGRWWMEVPVVSEEKIVILPCSFRDYKTACNQEVPDRWLYKFNLIK